MSKFNNTPTFTAAAFGAAALFSVLSFVSSAEAANILSCKGATASTVKSCCEQLVAEKGRPSWMVQSGSTCSSLVVCTKKSERCSMKLNYAKSEEGESRERSAKK